MEVATTSYGSDIRTPLGIASPSRRNARKDTTTATTASAGAMKASTSTTTTGPATAATATATATAAATATAPTATASSSSSASSSAPHQRAHTLDDFDIGSELGMGKFGHVFRVRERKTKTILAMKVMHKKEIKEAGVVNQLRREIEIHSRLRHPGIIRFFSYFQDAERVYVVLECANGGNLFDRLTKSPEGRFSETRTARYMKQLVEVMQYLHSKGIIHRDIKPENILLCTTKTPDGRVREILKLADFGWSVVQRKDSVRTTLCGTPDYLPPEVLQGHEYGPGVDIWTLGVLMYEFLVGNPPFAVEGEDINNTYDRIEAADYSIPSFVSIPAQDLINKMLQFDASKRPSLEEVLNHPWITANAGASSSRRVVAPGSVGTPSSSSAASSRAGAGAGER